MIKLVAPIVEGHGEVFAVPELLRRLASEISPGHSIRVNPPLRVKSSSFLRDATYSNNYIALAANKAAEGGNGLVLILLDCEDDCPARLGPELLERARRVRSDVPCLVALAHREYETWFLSAAPSLGGKQGLPANLEPPEYPETIRDAKGWLRQRMPGGYDPVVDQAAFTRAFDLAEAARVPSFRRLIERLGFYFRSSSPHL
jgi:hypothetical protein